MKHAINSLFRSEGLRQSVFLAFGNVGATALSAVSLIILSRYLGPSEFGGFSVAFSLTQLVARIGDLGSNTALQRFVASHHKHAKPLAEQAVALIGWVKFGMMVASLMAGVFAGKWVATAFFNVNDTVLVNLGIMLAAVIVWYEYVLGTMLALGKFGSALALNAIQAGAKCVMAVISLLLIPANTRFVYGWYGLAPLLSAMYGSIVVKEWWKRVQVTPKVSQELWRVAKFAAVGVAATTIGDNVDVLMVNASLDEYQTGLYSAAARIALMVAVLSGSFGSVFNTRVAKYTNQHDMRSFLTKSMAFAVLSLLLIPVVPLFSRLLLLIASGSHYLPAADVLNLLMASALMTLAYMPFAAVFYAVDYPWYFAVAGILQAGLLIGGNLLLIPVWGIEGAGAAKLIARAAVLVYTIAAAYVLAHRQFQTGKPRLSVIFNLFRHKKPIEPMPTSL